MQRLDVTGAVRPIYGSFGIRWLTNASYTNKRRSAGQVSIATEVANPEEKNADHLVPPTSAYERSTTHSKDVRFPWVTLYEASFNMLSMCWCMETSFSGNALCSEGHVEEIKLKIVTKRCLECFSRTLAPVLKAYNIFLVLKSLFA